MKLKKMIPVLLGLCSVFLGGCWDKVEIDRKIFISSIAVDPGKDINEAPKLKGIKIDEPFAERNIKKLNITYSYPNISSNEKKGTFIEKNILTEAYSMEDGFSQATFKSSRDIHLGHTKMLILSEEILNYPDIVKEVIDYFQRNPSINRMMYVVASEGRAEEIEKFKPSMENNFQTYMSGLMENSSRNASILPVTLNELLVLLNENGNAIIPSVKIDKEKNELSLTGIALIKNYKLEGYLNPIETADVEIIRGKLKGGKKVIYKEGHPIDYTIEGIERKIRMDKYEGKKIIFNMDTKLEGELRGYTVDKSAFSNKDIEQFETALGDSLSAECERVVKSLQNKYKMDILGMREYIEKYKPETWEKIKDNWEDVFKGAKININVSAKIRRIGVSK